MNGVFLKQLLRVFLVMERVDFDLIDGGNDLVVKHEIQQAVGIEVADADRADATGLIQLFHRTPSAIDITKRLVDEPEVQIVELQLVQGTFESGLRALVCRVLNPELGCDKQIASINAVVADRGADGLFIAI
ncbi:hypothetical protein D3C78_1414800 [compost metagenome]